MLLILRQFCRETAALFIISCYDYNELLYDAPKALFYLPQVCYTIPEPFFAIPPHFEAWLLIVSLSFAIISASFKSYIVVTLKQSFVLSTIAGVCPIAE